MIAKHFFCTPRASTLLRYNLPARVFNPVISSSEIWRVVKGSLRSVRRGTSLTMASTGPVGPTVAFKGSMDTYAALEGLKRESPAAERNKKPILDVLVEYLADKGATTLGRRRPLILEVASGSGQHAAALATALPSYDIQPSDVTPELFGSVTAYCNGLANVRLPPLLLNASAADWTNQVAAAADVAVAAGPGGEGSLEAVVTSGVAAAPDRGGDGDGGGGISGSSNSLAVAAILCVNMCHISPVEATRGLLRGAGLALQPGSGLLFVYGPFTRDRKHTTDSNAAFDASLRARNASWGYRDLGDMQMWAEEGGLELLEVREMPANNFMLVFKRRAK